MKIELSPYSDTLKYRGRVKIKNKDFIFYRDSKTVLIKRLLLEVFSQNK